jgi:hypothetical protein
VEVGLRAINRAREPLEVLDSAIDTTHGDEERGSVEDVYYCHPPRKHGVKIYFTLQENNALAIQTGLPHITVEPHDDDDESKE